MAHRHGRGARPRGSTVVPGADAFIKRLRESGRPFLVLTNNSIYTPRDLTPGCSPIGLDVPEGTSGRRRWPPAQFLEDQRPGGTAYVIGEAGLTTALHDVGYTLTDRRAGLRRARRDPYVQLRAHLASHPPDQRRRTLHRDQPGPDRAVSRGPLPATGSVAALITRATGRSRTSSASRTR